VFQGGNKNINVLSEVGYQLVSFCGGESMLLNIIIPLERLFTGERDYCALFSVVYRHELAWDTGRTIIDEDGSLRLLNRWTPHNVRQGSRERLPLPRP
jgi:hypothetical protein